MSTDYPVVPLGTVVSHRKEFIEINDAQLYKRCRVQLHAKGIVMRDEVAGDEIKTKRQQVCRSGELLIAEIDAKVGGYGIVPDHLAGAIVSSHYFLFEINDQMLDNRYLGYYLRTPAFREQVSAQGSTNYAAIRPQHVLDYVIPLPALREQERIVARVEALLAHVDEARTLRVESTKMNSSVLQLSRRAVFESSPRIALQQVLVGSRGGAWGDADDPDGTIVLRANNVSRTGRLNLQNVATRHVPDKQIQKLRLSDGDIILTKSNSIELVGNSAVFQQPKDSDRSYIPSNFMQWLRVDRSKYDPLLLWHYLNSAEAKDYYRLNAFGTSPSLQNLNGTKIGAMPIPDFPLPLQDQSLAYLNGIMEKTDSVNRLQSDSAVQLDALLPTILGRMFQGEL